MSEEQQQAVDEIHYYCSANVLTSILIKRRLWLTDLSVSNDSLEGMWALERFVRSIDPGTLERDSVKKRAARFVIRQSLMEHFALGMCFSGKKDLLSQWRGYADEGAGFCVSFPKSSIQKIAKEGGGVFSNLLFDQVSYDKSLDDLCQTKMSEAFDEYIAKYLETSAGAGFVGRGKADQLREAVQRMYLAKNPAFEEEDEYRLFLVSRPEDLSEMSIRESGGVISPKVELEIDLADISSVTMGPRNQIPFSTMLHILKKMECSATLHSSKASLRKAGS